VQIVAARVRSIERASAYNVMCRAKLVTLGKEISDGLA
jgi:hypothetical protein